VVPLVAMARQAVDLGTTDRLRLAISGSRPSELPYLPELYELGATVALTGPSGRFLHQVELGPERFDSERVIEHRISEAELRPLLEGVEVCYVCGSAGFCEAISQALVRCGAAASMIRVERFGPS
jgi:ferredoxin-NADP reductase